MIVSKESGRTSEVIGRPCTNSLQLTSIIVEFILGSSLRLDHVLVEF